MKMFKRVAIAIGPAMAVVVVSTLLLVLVGFAPSGAPQDVATAVLGFFGIFGGILALVFGITESFFD